MGPCCAAPPTPLIHPSTDTHLPVARPVLNLFVAAGLLMWWITVMVGLSNLGNATVAGPGFNLGIAAFAFYTFANIVGRMAGSAQCLTSASATDAAPAAVAGASASGTAGEAHYPAHGAPWGVVGDLLTRPTGTSHVPLIGGTHAGPLSP